MRLFTVFTLVFFISNLGFSQDRKIRKVIDLINSHEFQKAEESINDLGEKSENSSLLYLVKSRLYGSTAYSNYNNDSCFIYYNKAFDELLKIESKEQVQICENFNFCLISSISFKDSLAFVAFNLYSRENSIEKMLEFNRIYSGMSLVNESNKLIEGLYFKEAMESNSLIKLEDFLEKYPSNLRRQEIIDKIHEVEYYRVVQLNDRANYVDYVLKYPNSRFKSEIKSKIESIDFYAIKLSNDLNEYYQFLIEYPYSSFKSELYSIFEPIAYNHSVSAKDKSKLVEFKSRFPNSSHIEEVNNLICQLDFEDATKANTYDAFKTFKSMYPASKFDDGASSKILELFPFIPKLKANGKYVYINKQTNLEVFSKEFEDAELFYNEQAKVKLNGKWGVIDENGTIIIPTIFDNINPLHCNSNYYECEINNQSDDDSKDNTWLYNIDGKQLLATAEYMYCDENYNGQEDFLIINSDEKSYYKLVNKGLQKVNLTYDEMPYFNEKGYAVVSRGTKNLYDDEGHVTGLFGLIDRNYNEVLPIKYTYLEVLKENSDYYIFNIDGKLQSAPCGLDLDYFPSGGKWGVLNTQGKIIIPAVFDYLEVLNPYDTLEAKYLVARRGIQYDEDGSQSNPGVCGLIDLKGNEIIPFEYMEIDMGERDQLICRRGGDWYYFNGFSGFDSGGKLGVIDYSNKLLIPFLYDKIESTENLGYIVRKGEIDKAKFGLVTSSNQSILPCSFEDISVLGNNAGFIITTGGKTVCGETACSAGCWSVGGKQGLLNQNGKVILPNNYTEISPSINNDLFIINVGKKYDFSKWDDGEIIDEGKYGLADGSGKIILAAKFDDLWMNDNFVFASMLNKYQIFNKKGQLVSDRKFDELWSISDNYIGFRIGEKKGILKSDLSELFPVKFWITKSGDYYDYGINFEDPYFRIEEGGSYFYADQNGRVYRD
jgi:hypothetical protein